MNIRDRIKWGTVLLLLSLMGVGNAWADRGYGHGHYHGSTQFGFVFAPAWNPWYYSPPYYPPYQTVVIERAPPVYIEQSLPPPAPQASQTSYWYYCNASRAYYPYVRECPGGYRRVLAQAPN